MKMLLYVFIYYNTFIMLFSRLASDVKFTAGESSSSDRGDLLRGDLIGDLLRLPAAAAADNLLSISRSFFLASCAFNSTNLFFSFDQSAFIFSIST